jgi:hypothetical protein
VLTIFGTYPWSFVVQIIRKGWPNQGVDRNNFEAITSI